jgi:hypothetical protein
MTDSNASNDRRAEGRTSVRLNGTLFHPVTGKQINCIVTDLSSGGAGLWCEQPLPAGTALTVYIDGFGRFDGVSSRDMLGHTGIAFADPRQCAGLKESLIAYVRDGMKAVTRLRRTDRGAPDAAIGHFRRANGEAVPCDVLDVSLRGASLRTRQRPPVGEVVHLAGTRGWVVRHSAAGVGVQFLENRV